MSHADIMYNENRVQIDHEMFGVASKVLKKYNEEFPHCRVDQDSGYTLLKYGVSEFYKEHTDHYLGDPRTVSCSFAINDNYEGGGWSFFGGRVNKFVKKGAAIMFPSNFMYPHQILPVTSGIRYSIVTWFV